MGIRTAAAAAAIVIAAGSASATLVDFTNDGYGNSLANGQSLGTNVNFAPEFTLSSSGSNEGMAIFDSSDPGPNDASGDQDLLVGLGNLLIFQNSGSSKTGNIFNSPNDDADGGTFVFDFTSAVTLQSLAIVDVDGGNTATVTLTDANTLTRVYTVPQSWTYDINASGPDGYDTLDLTTLVGQLGEGGSTATAVEDAGFDADSVLSLTVYLSGSGGIDNLSFVPTPGAAALLGLAGVVGVRRRRNG